MKAKDFVAIKNNKIIAEFQTTQGEDGVKKSLIGIDYDAIEEVFDNDGEIKTGRDRREFDDKFKLFPLAHRVKNGYVKAQDGYILDGDSIRPMTLVELVKSGIVEVPDRMKISENNFVLMTDEELIESGQATREQVERDRKNVEEEKLIADKMRELAIAELKKEGKMR